MTLLIEEEIEALYQLVGANEGDQFVLTSSNSESITHVFHSIYYDHMLKSGKTQFLLSNLEGSAVLLNGARFEDLGALCETVSVNSLGLLTKDILNLHTTPKSGALFMSLSNPMTGVVQSIADIASYCEEHDIWFHLDISDAIGHTYFSFKDFPISSLSFSWKTGCGALFVKEGLKFSNLIPSAGALNPLRGGEIDPILLSDFCKEARAKMEEMDQENMHLSHLRDIFERTIQNKNDNVKPLYMQLMRTPHQTVVQFPKVAADLMAFHLKEEGIKTYFGGEFHQKLEYILSKSGFDAQSAGCALGFEFSVEMTPEIVEKQGEKVALTYEKLLALVQDLSFEDPQ